MGAPILRRVNRRCPENRRIWGDYFVDLNLRDDWLEALNKLNSYNMISICEGHYQSGNILRGSPPHINLRLKEQYIPLIISELDGVLPQMHIKVIELFGKEDTQAEIEYRIKLNSSRFRQEIRRDFVFKVFYQIPRETSDMNTLTIKWFEDIIDKIQEFDDLTKTILLKIA